MPPLPANVNECLIRVQCNIAQMLIDGRAGVLQFRVINEHEHKVSVQLDAFSEIIPRPGLSKRSPPIDPNRFEELRFQLSKHQVEAGTYVIDLRVSVDSVGGDEVCRCYSAEFLYEVMSAPVPGAPTGRSRRPGCNQRQRNHQQYPCGFTREFGGPDQES